MKKLDPHTLPAEVGENATLLANWVELLYRCLVQRGFDAAEIFAELDIDPVRAQQADTRISSLKIKQIWDMASQRSGDIAFGLTAAEVAFPAMFNSLSVAMSASDTLLDAFQRFMRFRRVIDTTCINTLEEVEDGYKFTWAPVTGLESNVGAEAFVAALMTLCRWSSGPDFHPQRVTLMHRLPDEVERYRQFFNAPVELQTGENALYFSKASMEKNIVTANRQLAVVSDQLSADNLARTERTDLVNQVYNKLLNFLPQRLFSEEIIAEELNMSLRSLQRKLKEQGTSYDALFQSVRRTLALQLMNDPQLSIADVSRFLGFSSPSNFGRAFKRWTGQTPLEYRRSSRG